MSSLAMGRLFLILAAARMKTPKPLLQQRLQVLYRVYHDDIHIGGLELRANGNFL